MYPLLTLLLLLSEKSNQAEQLGALFKAQFALKSGDLAQAQQFIDRALTLGPVEAETAYLHAEIMLAVAARNPGEVTNQPVMKALLGYAAAFPKDYRFAKVLGMFLAREHELFKKAQPDAVFWLRRALELLGPSGHPTERSEVSYFLGLVLFRNQAFPEAADAFKKYLDLDGESEWAHYYAARSFELSHQLRSALRYYTSFAELSSEEPDEVPIAFSIRLLQLVVAPGPKEELALLEWLAARKNARVFYFEAATQLLQVGRHAAALAVLQALPVAFRDPNYYRLLSHARMSLHQYETLFGEIQAVMSSSPERVRLYLVDYAIESGLASGKFAEVIKLRETYPTTPDLDLKLDTYTAFAENLLTGSTALWQKCQERHEKSTLILAMTREAEATSFRTVALRNYSQVFVEWGDWERGLTYALEAQHTSPNESQANEDLAIAYYQTGFFEECFGLYERLLRAQPNREDLLNNYGFFLAESGRDYPRAQKMVEKALVQDPENGAYLDSLGWIYYKQGKLLEAEELLTRALASDANDPEKLEHLGDIYKARLQPERARKYWIAAMEQRSDRYLTILDKLDPHHD